MNMNNKKYLILNPKTTNQISIYGLPYFETERTYLRIQEKDYSLVNQLSESLAILTKNTAGCLVAFYAISNYFAIQVKGLKHFHMTHMAYTGQAGFDLYMGKDAFDLSFYQTCKFNVSDETYYYTFFENLTQEKKLFVLYFPLYASIEELNLFFDDNALVEPCTNLFPKGRIVFYGTSITQGGCASRPGMSYPSIISRKIQYECINYGFSGNGKGQIEMAELVAKIKDVKLFVLDYEANADEDNLLQKTLEPFIKTIWSYHPMTPILVISKIMMSKEYHNQNSNEKYRSLYLFQKRLIQALQKENSNLFFLNGQKLLAPMYHEATVDGIHPTDLGFYQMAEKIVKKINQII